MGQISMLYIFGVLMLPGCFFFGITDGNSSNRSEQCDDTAYGGCDTGPRGGW